jgi:Skp family chaperone for outer membrane proteins
MKKFLFALLLLAPTCFGATDNPDGSITFTEEEARSLLQNFQQMEADQERAVLIFKRMQNEIDRLEKEKKEMKCS